MYRIIDFSKIKSLNTSLVFKTLMWFILLLTIFTLFDLYDIDLFKEKSLATQWNPTALLFGPALYLGVSILKGRQHFSFLKHFSPFLILALIYIVVGWTTDLHEIVYTEQISPYHYIYLLIPLSLLYYGSRGINSLFYIKKDQYDGEIELLMVLSAIYIIAGMLYTLIFISWGVLSLETGLDYRLLVYSLAFISCLFIIRYLCTYDKTDLVIKSEVIIKSYSNSTLKQSKMQYYQDLIVNCFENTRIYLRSDISLDVLANELDIPKHHLSQVLNVYFKKSFYSFVADYRIKYAINKIELNRGALTLESLAYECGFNSRTSFNNYFKKITNLTPAEYQAQACKIIA